MILRFPHDKLLCIGDGSACVCYCTPQSPLIALLMTALQIQSDALHHMELKPINTLYNALLGSRAKGSIAIDVTL